MKRVSRVLGCACLLLAPLAAGAEPPATAAQPAGAPPAIAVEDL